MQRDSKYEKLNPNPFLLVFGFNKTQNVVQKCSWMVLVHFEDDFHCFDWLGLVLRNGCKKENVGFLKEMLSKICQNPCSCFGYRLSYNHSNEVILIGKES